MVFCSERDGKAETDALNPDARRRGQASCTRVVIVDFILGILTVWVYAAIRPRFGPGPRTALTAALASGRGACGVCVLCLHGYYSWPHFVRQRGRFGGPRLAGGYIGARL